MRFLSRSTKTPELTAEDMRRLRQRRDDATTALRDAQEHLAAWADEAKRWPQLAAEHGQAEQFTGEVEDVLRRQAGLVRSL